jgi:hypothetical protein
MNLKYCIITIAAITICQTAAAIDNIFEDVIIRLNSPKAKSSQEIRALSALMDEIADSIRRNVHLSNLSENLYKQMLPLALDSEIETSYDGKTAQAFFQESLHLLMEAVIRSKSSDISEADIYLAIQSEIMLLKRVNHDVMAFRSKGISTKSAGLWNVVGSPPPPEMMASNALVAALHVEKSLLESVCSNLKFILKMKTNNQITAYLRISGLPSAELARLIAK